MTVVLYTHSLSLAESVRLALLAEGIDAVMLDQSSPGTLGLAGSVRVAIVNDADAQRAARIIARLQPPESEPLPSWWWHKRAFVALSAAILLALLGAVIPGLASIRDLRLALSAAGGFLFVGALVLLFLGYRADKHPSGGKS
jgi:Putative prokaryotic signal transducing protein